MISVLLVACAAFKKESKTPIQQLEELNVELKTNAAHYTRSDYEKAFHKYESICKRIDYDSMTLEERREVGRLEGEISAIFGIYLAGEYENILKGAFYETEGVLEGILNILN